jgi:probable phosphoglycerate mutase
MALLIARHGQTDWNVAHRWQSRSDIPLNTLGYQQAQKLGDLLKARGFAPIQMFSSPLERARETAAILGQTLGLNVAVEPALVELDLGDYEGRLESEIRAGDNDAYDDWRQGCYLKPPPGGEGILDVACRIKDFAANLDDTAGDILLVGHQGVNMAIKAQLSNCFTRECLNSFRQDNDEIDLWELDPAYSAGRLRIASDEPSPPI